MHALSTYAQIFMKGNIPNVLGKNETLQNTLKIRLFEASIFFHSEHLGMFFLHENLYVYRQFSMFVCIFFMFLDLMSMREHLSLRAETPCPRLDWSSFFLVSSICCKVLTWLVKYIRYMVKKRGRHAPFVRGFKFPYRKRTLNFEIHEKL